MFDPNDPPNKYATRRIAARLRSYSQRAGPSNGPEHFFGLIDRREQRDAARRSKAGAEAARSTMADLKHRYLN